MFDICFSIYLLYQTGSSSHGSGSNTSANISNNNFNKTCTNNGNESNARSHVVTSEVPSNRQLPPSSAGGWDAASVSVSASAPPSCGSGGSVDDEWSKQMDELDRLRPSTAEPPMAAAAASCGNSLSNGRSVIDFFTDLPDVVIEDDPLLLNQLTKSDEVG